MLALNPSLVRFGGQDWRDVTLVAVDRVAARPVLEWTDLGPFPAFADTPEQRVDVKIVRALERDEPAPPRPGDSAAVEFRVAPGAGAPAHRVAFTGVVVAVRHELSGRSAAQTVQLVALSPDGAADPIAVTEDQP